MKLAFYTPCISPHQLPLANELSAVLGDGSFWYVYAQPFDGGRDALGWGTSMPDYCIPGESEWGRQILLSADALVSGIRDVDLFKARAQKGLRTFYTSERWFKPPIGILRLVVPRYFRMAYEIFRLMCSGNVIYLPTGRWAAYDMIRLHSLLSYDVCGALVPPKLSFESIPLGKCYSWSGRAGARMLGYMRMWGYFVAASCQPMCAQSPIVKQTLQILWVGRMLDWKCVDTLLKAVRECHLKQPGEFRLTIAGIGPEERRLREFSRDSGIAAIVTFLPSVPIGEVRELMRSHDVYVLSSNGYEGWGAVVSEALEEGMEVLGTKEAGSTSTLLPTENLYAAGDYKALSRLLIRCAQGERKCCGIGHWSAKEAAKRLVEFVRADLER